ncbi:MAG: LysR family transcriptional regulator [Pseudomonadota bacterium]
MFTRNYRLLAYFEEIVKTGSVRGAARNLFVTPPVVSKALADLEEELGSTLFQRKGRKLKLTEEGTRVHHFASQMARSAVDAMSSIDGDESELSGDIKITLPTELASAWLPPVLTRFMRAHPGVTANIDAIDEMLDLPTSANDLAIRAEFYLDQDDTMQNYFVWLPLSLVCAPTLLDQAGRSLKSQLETLPFIAFTRVGIPETVPARHRRTRRLASFSHNAVVHVNSGQLIHALTQQGYGVALLIDSAIQSELDSGDLVRIGEDYSFGYVALRVEFRDQYPSRAARVFQRFIAGEV